MSKFVIFNGSRKGLFQFILDEMRTMGTKRNMIYLMDIPEENVHVMRTKYPGTEAHYLYDSEDLKDKTIHDIGPTLNLYNSFIKVNKN